MPAPEIVAASSPRAPNEARGAHDYATAVVESDGAYDPGIIARGCSANRLAGERPLLRDALMPLRGR